MLTPIHRALGRVPSPVTWDLIVQAVEQRVEEAADLDWKRSVYDHRDPKWQDEAAKDIAAMANSGGGWIVFGIAEDRKTSAASDITGVIWSQEVEQRMLRAAYTRIGPPLVGLKFHVVQDPSGDVPDPVVLMRVPDSPDRPHLARKDESAFVGPVRNGPHTAFMTDRDIERAFRDRFSLRATKEKSLQDLYVETGEHLDPHQGVCLDLVAVPHDPRTVPVEIDSAGAYRVFDDTNPKALHDPRVNANSVWRWSANRVRRGRRQWISRSTESGAAVWKAIHDDGTVRAVFRLGGLTQDERDAPYRPVGEPNHCLSIDIEHALADGVALLRDWTERLEVAGGYRLRAGLVGIAGQPIYIRTTEARSNFMLPLDHAEPILRPHPVTVDLDPLSRIEDLVTMTSEVALDLINQGGVQYLRLLPDPSP